MKRYIKPAIALASLLTLLLVGYLIYQSLVFRLVGITPDLSKEVATSTSTITLHFNHELENKFSLAQIESAGLVKSASVSGQDLTLKTGSIEKDKPYQLTIRSIASKKGERLENLSFRFTGRYIEFGKLSKAEQEQQIRATDPYSIANVLPHETDSYRISVESTGRDRPTIYVDMKFVGSSLSDSRYINSVRQYRNEAFAYLASKRVDRTQYYFEYSEPILLAEFLGYYGSDSDHGDHDHNDEVDNFTGDGVPPEQQ